MGAVNYRSLNIVLRHLYTVSGFAPVYARPGTHLSSRSSQLNPSS